MDTILLFKNDLDRYSNSSLKLLQRYLNLPAADRQDLIWMIAIYQSQNNYKKMQLPSATASEMWRERVVLPVRAAVEDGIFSTIDVVFVFDTQSEGLAQAIADFLIYAEHEKVLEAFKPVLDNLHELTHVIFELVKIEPSEVGTYEEEVAGWPIEAEETFTELRIDLLGGITIQENIDNRDSFEVHVPYDNRYGVLYMAAQAPVKPVTIR